jgi:hypothetical protein
VVERENYVDDGRVELCAAVPADLRDRVSDRPGVLVGALVLRGAHFRGGPQ